jgi:hypothetical protein
LSMIMDEKFTLKIGLGNWKSFEAEINQHSSNIGQSRLKLDIES